MADPEAARDIGAMGREWLCRHGSAASRVAFYLDAYDKLRRDPALIRRQPELAFRDAGLADLKYYQHLLAWHVLAASLPEGATVLEIGGDSPLGRVLAGRFDHVNLDPLAGCGNGPTAPPAAPPGRLVRAALGDFFPALPDRFFDAVVSVSALDHTPEDPPAWSATCRNCTF